MPFPSAPPQAAHAQTRHLMSNSPHCLQTKIHTLPRRSRPPQPGSPIPSCHTAHHSPLPQAQSHHTERPSHTGLLAASANNTPLQNCAQHSRLSSNTTSGRVFLSLLSAPTAARSFILTFSPPVKDICSFLALGSHALFL